MECGRWSEKSSLFWIIVLVSLFITGQRAASGKRKGGFAESRPDPRPASGQAGVRVSSPAPQQNERRALQQQLPYPILSWPSGWPG